MSLLRTGALEKHSLPCALLYARFLAAIDRKSITDLQRDYDVVEFLLKANTRSAGDWGDPQEDVVSYGSKSDKVCGDEVSTYSRITPQV